MKDFGFWFLLGDFFGRLNFFAWWNNWIFHNSSFSLRYFHPLLLLLLLFSLATFIESSPVFALSSEYSWFRYLWKQIKGTEGGRKRTRGNVPLVCRFIESSPDSPLSLLFNWQLYSLVSTHPSGREREREREKDSTLGLKTLNWG